MPPGLGMSRVPLTRRAISSTPVLPLVQASIVLVSLDVTLPDGQDVVGLDHLLEYGITHRPRYRSFSETSRLRDGAIQEGSPKRNLFHLIVQRNSMAGEKGRAERKMKDRREQELSILPTEIRDTYLDVTRYHRKLLARLAQR